MDGKHVLKIPMAENDSEARTIHGYLTALLEKLWEKGESFSGKRPFGNSGWKYDLYGALVKAGTVKGKLDEYGNVEDVDTQAANSAIFAAIHAL